MMTSVDFQNRMTHALLAGWRKWNVSARSTQQLQHQLCENSHVLQLT